jgi:hypothetical protein
MLNMNATQIKRRPLSPDRRKGNKHGDRIGTAGNGG